MASLLSENKDFQNDLRGEMSSNAIAKKYKMARSGVQRWRMKLKLEPVSISEGQRETSESSDGTKTVEAIRSRPVTLDDARAWIKATGDDPDDYTLSIRSIAYGVDMFSNRMSASPKTKKSDPKRLDLPSLYAAARTKPRERVIVAPADRATVVVFADPQIGKTGRRGGTPELLDRMAEKREKLDDLLKVRKPQRTLLADGGDGFEGFNSGGNPMFTNDLSLAQQMDCYGTELFAFVDLLHQFGPVDVGAVLSNHTAWRNGKQNLGIPADDLGLFVHKQVRKVTTASKIDATWHFPDDYDESVAVDVMGTSIGLVHGNQFGPGGAISWWERQAFGAQAVTSADVLITAHYHTFGVGMAGRNPMNGRQRVWLGAPTLDNGSDYYRQTAGRDSDPGLMVFDVTPDGFDLQSLTIL